MSHAKVKSSSPQRKGIEIESKKEATLPARQGTNDGIDEMFEAMQKNFDETFKNSGQSQIPKLTTELMTNDQTKQAVHTSRSNRKLKPMYSNLVKRHPSHNSQNFNSDSKNRTQSNQQHLQSQYKQQLSPNPRHTLNQSSQKSNKSSPYAKIMGRLKESTISQFHSNEEYPSSIEIIQTQRKNGKINQAIQTLDETPNDPKSSSRGLNYKDLQQKIESALKKNNNHKTFRSSRLNNSNLTSRTFNQFNEMLLSRFEQYEKNREREIQQKKLQLQQRNQKQLKFHPKINKKSLQFVQQMGGHQTLQNRYQKILELKNKKLQQYQEQKRLKQEEEYEQFKQEFLKYQKTPEQATRSYEKFYQEMFKWKQRALKNAEEKKKLIEQDKLKSNNTFHPKINKKSKKIVMNSTKSEKYLPIHQRQIPAQKKFKSKIDQECTFKPKINKRKIK